MTGPSAAGFDFALALGAPLAVRSVDVSSGFPDLSLGPARSGLRYRGAVVLLWNEDGPAGWVGLYLPPETGKLTAADLERAFVEQLLPDAQVAVRAEPSQSGETAKADGVEALVSHVVTTCNQPLLAERCIRSILAAERGPFEIIVVENRPTGSSVRRALAGAFPGDERIRVIDQPVPGLSRARNAGLATSCGSIVSFTDDDIAVDSRWAGSLREAFARNPEVSCVTGPILPAELETPSQVLMERYAPIGTGFARRAYSLAQPPPVDEQPLFPYTSGYFGSGGNAAFRREALEALRGFDPVLGTGTAACGGEDLDVLTRFVLAGERLLYQPRAVVWHPHPRTMELLRREMFRYGVGLSAFLTKQLVAGPDRASLIKKIPQGMRYLTSASSHKNAGKGRDYPTRLDRLEMAGLGLGPLAYARSLWQERRLRAAGGR